MKKLLGTISFALAISSAPVIADDLEFKAELTGDEEVPVPVDTGTTGEAKFEINDDMTRIEFELEIEDGLGILAGPGGHLHCAPRGENGPIIAFMAAGLPFGFNGDVELKASLEDGNISPTDCGSTVADVVEAMLDGKVYVNIHSAAFPAGEIRGQVAEE